MCLLGILSLWELRSNASMVPMTNILCAGFPSVVV